MPLGELLYFTNEKSFVAAIERPFSVDAAKFASYYSYDGFAQRIMADLQAEGLLRDELGGDCVHAPALAATG